MNSTALLHRFYIHKNKKTHENGQCNKIAENNYTSYGGSGGGGGADIPVSPGGSAGYERETTGTGSPTPVQGYDGGAYGPGVTGNGYSSAGGGGAWNWSGTQTADDSASLTQTGIDATYATYAIILEDFHPDTNNAAIIFRMGPSSGIASTWGH